MRRWRRLLLLLVARAVASAVTRFGLFDFESSPGAGWQLMSSADFTEHKAEFIAAYNAGEGIKVIAKFQSGNVSSAKVPHFMRVLASDIASPMFLFSALAVLYCRQRRQQAHDIRFAVRLPVPGVQIGGHTLQSNWRLHRGGLPVL